MALGAKIVDFIWLDRAQDPIQRAGVVQVAIDEMESPMGHMRILINRINSTRVERAGTADNAVHLVPSP
jgi:hypothetical protein